MMGEVRHAEFGADRPDDAEQRRLLDPDLGPIELSAQMSSRYCCATALMMPSGLSHEACVFSSRVRSSMASQSISPALRAFGRWSRGACTT